MNDRSVSLSVLLKDAPPREAVGVVPPLDCSAVFCDSRETRRHGARGLFVCIEGARRDGHDFAEAVYDAGCRIFAVTRVLPLPSDALQLVYTDTRVALALLSASFYGHPSRSLSVVGVTGTKGKTTTALIAHSLLLRAGIPTGYIGTSGIRYADVAYESPNTTPESLILQRTMREMVDCGIRVLVMEVSSQALMQHRVSGTKFAVTLFTNLSPDHVGPTEHPTFEHYKETKRTLFTAYPSRVVLLNADDPAAAEMLPKDTDVTVETFSVHGDAAPAALPRPVLTARDAHPTLSSDGHPGIAFSLGISEKEALPVFLPLPGLCNVSNALAALAICKALGLSVTDAAASLPSVSVAGRCETVETGNGVRVLIDYAHNEASLREILTALRAYRPKRLIVLFGSVGGRTKERRPTMGRVASELADLSILTSDNPDFESPDDVLSDIERGMAPTAPRIKIPDRREAIRYALSISEAGDILLLAGKGHETYQLVCGEKRPFSEKEIVEEWVFRTQNA